MSKTNIVQCNHRNDPDCAGCAHRMPHEIEDKEVMKCTQWGDCLLGKDRMIKVRCVRVKQQTRRAKMAANKRVRKPRRGLRTGPKNGTGPRAKAGTCIKKKK